MIFFIRFYFIKLKPKSKAKDRAKAKSKLRKNTIKNQMRKSGLSVDGREDQLQTIVEFQN